MQAKDFLQKVSDSSICILDILLALKWHDRWMNTILARIVPSKCFSNLCLFITAVGSPSQHDVADIWPICAACTRSPLVLCPSIVILLLVLVICARLRCLPFLEELEFSHDWHILETVISSAAVVAYACIVE